MDNFLVSARKYRPARFEEVVGQGSVTNTLKNAIKTNQVAHAFLFCGPRGVGKTTCARILAKTINCLNPAPDGEACNQCECCISFNSNSAINVHELDAASNNGVDDIRSLNDQVRYAPQIGRYKIYIIDEVHMLSTAAFNAFLKTLEEPPAHAKFILATTEKHKILPTILSRCQIFDFSRISNEDISDHLESICKNEKIPYSKDALFIISQKADGGLRDALSMFDRLVSFGGGELSYEGVVANLNILDYDYFFKITDQILEQDAGAVLISFDEILKKGFEGEDLLNGLAEHFRNLLVCKDSRTLSLLSCGENRKQRYQSQAQLAEADLLLNSLNIANQAAISLKMAKNTRLAVELALLKMSQLPHVMKIEVAADGEKSEEKKKPEQITPAQQSANQEKVEPKPKQENEPQLAPSDIKPDLPSARLSDLLAKSKAEPPKAPQTTDHLPPKVEEPDINPQPVELNQESIASAMEEFKEYLSAEKQPLLLSLIQTSTWAWNNQTLKFTFSGNHQAGLFENEKKEVTAFFRKKYGVILSIEVITDDTMAEQADKKPYTQQEMLAAMAKTNPAILELKQKLDLDLDY